MTFQSVDDVHGGDGLTFGVFGVGDGVTDHVLEEHLEDASGFFVDQPGDTFHTAATGQSSDGRFRYALDVVAQDFAMTFRATFSQAFASFSSTGHLGISSKKLARDVDSERCSKGNCENYEIRRRFITFPSYAHFWSRSTNRHAQRATL